MKPVNETAIAGILEAAKREFLTNGFEKASVRELAAEAGVTTGSIYAYFGSKEGLFDALVSDAAEQLLSFCRASAASFRALPEEEQLSRMVEASVSGSEYMLDFIYRHPDEFRLIACCSAGTGYADYIDRLAALEEQLTIDYIALLRKHGRQIKEISDISVHILVGTLFHGAFEIVAHDLPYEEAKEQIRLIERFYTAGWLDMFGMDFE